MKAIQPFTLRWVTYFHWKSQSFFRLICTARLTLSLCCWKHRLIQYRCFSFFQTTFLTKIPKVVKKGSSFWTNAVLFLCAASPLLATGRSPASTTPASSTARPTTPAATEPTSIGGYCITIPVMAVYNMYAHTCMTGYPIARACIIIHRGQAL